MTALRIQSEEAQGLGHTVRRGEGRSWGLHAPAARPVLPYTETGAGRLHDAPAAALGSAGRSLRTIHAKATRHLPLLSLSLMTQALARAVVLMVRGRERLVGQQDTVCKCAWCVCCVFMARTAVAVCCQTMAGALQQVAPCS